jgi:hypothetical protein
MNQSKSYVRRRSVLLVAAALLSAGSALSAGASASALPAAPSLGGVTEFPAAPAGFDAVHATATDLERYGFPRRPTDPSALAAWQQLMADAKTYVPISLTPRVDHTVPLANGSHSGGTSNNWAGNYTTGRTYEMDGAYWTIPGVPNGSGKYSSTWVGLGLGNSLSDPLIQTGNDQNSTGGGTSYGMWYEVYAYIDSTHSVNQEAYTSFHPSPGQQVYFDVEYPDGTNRQARFFVEDVATHQYQPFYITLDSRITGCSCQTADWIEENQGPNPGTAHNLASFGSATFTSAFDYDSANNYHHIGDLPHNYLNMVDNDGTVAYPGPLNGTGDGFTVYRTSTP